MQGTTEQTAKKPKTALTRTGHTIVSKPQWVGFSRKKTGCDNLKVGKKFSYPCLDFFHQNHPITDYTIY